MVCASACGQTVVAQDDGTATVASTKRGGCNALGVHMWWPLVLLLLRRRAWLALVFAIGCGSHAAPAQIAGGSATCAKTGAEICDGQDNDCNGVIDDAPSDAGQVCFGATGGACGLAAHQGVSVCLAGALSCAGSSVLEPFAQAVKIVNVVTGPLDAVQLAVMANRLDGIEREMSNTLLRAGRSAVINQALDFSNAIVTADNRLLSVAEGLPVHIFGAHLQAESMARFHTPREGDAYLHNDVYLGNTHPADHTILVPVFADGRHLFTASAKAHSAEIADLVELVRAVHTYVTSLVPRDKDPVAAPASTKRRRDTSANSRG